MWEVVESDSRLSCSTPPSINWGLSYRAKIKSMCVTQSWIRNYSRICPRKFSSCLAFFSPCMDSPTGLFRALCILVAHWDFHIQTRTRKDTWEHNVTLQKLPIWQHAFRMLYFAPPRELFITRLNKTLGEVCRKQTIFKIMYNERVTPWWEGIITIERITDRDMVWGFIRCNLVLNDRAWGRLGRLGRLGRVQQITSIVTNEVHRGAFFIYNVRACEILYHY